MRPTRWSRSAMRRRIEAAMIPFVKAHACGNDFLIIEETVGGAAACGAGAEAVRAEHQCGRGWD